MKNSPLFLFFLLYITILNSQTGIYSTNGVLTVEIPASVDVVTGYPSADELDPQAVSEYNKGSEILFSLNQINEEEREKALYKAIDYLIAAINYDEKFIQAYDNLGKAYRMVGNFKLAIQSYKISIKIFPSGTSAHQNLAVVYETLKEWDNSIMEYKVVINLAPQNPEGYYGLANIYQKMSKLDLALSNALIALELYEKNPPNYIHDSYLQVGLIYYYKKEKSLAKKYLKIAKEKFDENNISDRFTKYDAILKSL
jgi:tetratricopeptide (TPR) repeat protein